jgi:hypothetical protein
LVEEAQKALEEAEALKKVLLCLLGLFYVSKKKKKLLGLFNEVIRIILFHCAVLKYFYLPLSSVLFVSYFNCFVIAVSATCPAGACSGFFQVHCC